MSKKILCLPGYLQSGKVFAEKSSGIRKLLAKSYTLDYVNPPCVIQSYEDLPFSLGDTPEEKSTKWDALVKEDVNRCWFRYENGKHLGFHETVESIIGYIKENGPYQGIMGFSQGAAMAIMLTNSINQFLPEHPPFEVSIIISGFAFTKAVKGYEGNDAHTETESFEEYEKLVELDPEYEKYFLAPPGLPTKMFFISGAADGVVPAVRTKYAASKFNPDNVQEIVHDSGHLVPNKKPILRPIVESVKEILDAKPNL